MLNFYPNFIDNTNFKYINIDEKYMSTISIIGYPRKMGFLDFMNILPKDINYDMSIFAKKQDTIKILKEITYNISNSKAEIKTINKNQIDIDILDKITNDAINLRHEIQINNEEIYYIYILITIKGDTREDTIYKVKRFRNILYSKMIISNLLNFRHLDGYLSTLPLNIIEKDLLKSSYATMTTSNFANMFPFFTDTIFDKNGVIFGYTKDNKKICNIDIFSDKYTNSNMCIFGSSGSGKSYFVKLLILRHYIKNIKQYIFDPEGEYVNIALESGGEYINFNNNSEKHLNILDINEFDLMKDNFLELKVDKVYKFLNEMINIEKSQENFLKEVIFKIYIDKGINENKDSMYINSYKEMVFVNRKLKGTDYMPTLEDVLVYLKSKINVKNTEFKNLVIQFEKLLNDNSFIRSKTNINLNNSLIIYNLNGLNAKMAKLIFNFLIDNIIEKIKYEKQKTILYIDEVWKFIYNDDSSSEKIFMLYKTIRKLNAAIVTITQDISDFFSKDKGMYGKSVFNNSFIKMFFKVEYSDSEILQKCGILDTFGVKEISKLSKGNMVMSFYSKVINLEIKANNYEDQLIKGGEN